MGTAGFGKGRGRGGKKSSFFKVIGDQVVCERMKVSEARERGGWYNNQRAALEAVATSITDLPNGKKEYFTGDEIIIAN